MTPDLSTHLAILAKQLEEAQKDAAQWQRLSSAEQRAPSWPQRMRRPRLHTLRRKPAGPMPLARQSSQS